MQFELKEYHRNIPKEELIADLQRVAKENELVTVSQKKYGEVGKYTHKVFYANFGSWNNALLAAGLEVSRRNNVPVEDLFLNIEEVWVRLGRQPTYSEMNSSMSRFSTKPYESRFGSWRKALEEFVAYINQSGKQAPEPYAAPNNNPKGSRTINNRMRFVVMQRDCFTCRACGASPSKDPTVELHIDHIIPWSKGGATAIENLQTLCSKCNLGKSNLMFE